MSKHVTLFYTKKPLEAFTIYVKVDFVILNDDLKNKRQKVLTFDCEK